MSIPRPAVLLLATIAVFGAGALRATPAAGSPPPPPPPKSEAFLGRALAAAADRNWALAARFAAKGGDALVDKVIAWRRLTQSDPPAPFDEIAAFIDANPDWPGQRALRRRAEQALDDRVGAERVRAWFARHPPLTGPGRWRLAEAMLATGDEMEAVALLRRAWVDGDFTLSQERQFLKRHRKRLRAEDHVARLDRLLWERKRRAAQRMLRRVDPGHRALGIARLRLMVRAPGVDAAIAKVPPALRNDPGLWYERLRWRRRKGRDEAARAILDNPPAVLGRPEAWWREIRIQIRNALADGLISVGYHLASRHNQTLPLPRSEAEWLAGWIALRFLNDPALAAPHFQRLFEGVRYAVSLARAAYWAGRAAAAAGRADDARAWFARAARYPTTFYGALALARLDPDSSLSLPEAPAITDADRAFIRDHELAAVLRRLAALGREDLADPFILRLAALAATAGERRLVARLAREAGRFDLAVRIARRAASLGVVMPDEGYPMVALPPSPGRAASAVEPALLLAMLRQESGFHPRAVSSAGARGLMQIMPATARRVARGLRLPYSRVRLIEDPEYNLTIGRSYIETLLERYNGSYVLALAAYNAGPNRVRRWIERFGDPREPEVDVIDWIEMIPLSETRNYVQRVLEAVPVYRRRAGQPVTATSLARVLERGAREAPKPSIARAEAQPSPSL